ncbi:maleylpyruvate isomerase family mycothiol-dependent enzyme [Actinomadura kijaniata]|uniref:Uncharacterized protein (TIGR03083 family) n=1 Tax=Actinomadura namibiensis TaxID=182080 RepID=A0A7W3QPT9_ACTNM|nr:maleylpyruvate isomerase family mycothiol-dependent enzyme [Actinomadura namibiensis]MBA8954987.1 uncharacterized protein (TIGR03083 family) [Actinomadura namibiensis]
MEHPDASTLAVWLHEQTAAFAAAAEGPDLDTWVPTCPEWRMRDLVAHVGRAHRWAVELVASGSTEMPPQPEVTLPATPGERTGWLVEGAERLVEAVERVGPDTPVWSFLGRRTPAFWLRRMLHDTTVHHADAALTAGIGYRPEPALAADTLTEGLELMAAVVESGINPTLAELRGDGETLAFVPDETGVEGWVVTRTPDGLAWTRGGGDAHVTVAGPMASLLLVFSRRTRPDDASGVRVTGRRPLLDHWLERTAFG